MTEQEKYAADRSQVYETAEKLGMEKMVALMDEALWNTSDQTKFLSGDVKKLDEVFSTPRSSDE